MVVSVFLKDIVIDETKLVNICFLGGNFFLTFLF
jgi:hypothetical protein